MSGPDLSEFHKISSKIGKYRRCSVKQARDTLTADQRAQLDAALAAPSGDIPSGAIRLWLQRRDLDASIPGITSHRAGTCQCARERDD